MMSFIAKPIFFRPGEKGGVYPVRLSSRIRGEEMANYLGAEYTLNEPKFDKRIWLKPMSLDCVQDGDYVDILDGWQIVKLLKKRPKIKVITMTPVHHKYLKKRLDNELVFIPHHHINFDNEIKVRSKKLVGGIIGKGVPHVYKMFEELKEKLEKEGIGFKNAFEYQTRQDMINFYKSIDFLVIYYLHDRYRDLFYVHPTKIVNAASFGIPTISQKLSGYKEFDYIVAENYDGIVRMALSLPDWSEKLVKLAEKYHISKIAELYKKL